MTAIAGTAMVPARRVDAAGGVDVDQRAIIALAVPLIANSAVQLCAPGVYLVAKGTVFPATKVRKNLELNRFEPL